MKYIFGLGNPGRKYQATRHNVGFMVLDVLAERNQVSFKNFSKFDCLMGEGEVNNQRIRLIKPTTYMNNSGYAVSAVIDYYQVPLQDILLIYDDIDLPFGTLRIRSQGSAGTHNGMRSVIGYLHSQDFMRLRIGIGKPHFDLKEHVLGKFEKEKEEALQEMLHRAADAVECLVTEESLQSAQEKYQMPPNKIKTDGQ